MAVSLLLFVDDSFPFVMLMLNTLLISGPLFCATKWCWVGVNLRKLNLSQ